MLKLIKNNIKFILIYIIIFILLIIEFPYYIEAPGGIININNRINIENNYQSNGSLNLSYVSEYKATLITLFISLFNKDYKVLKKEEIIPDDINLKDYEYRDRLMLYESYSNATYIGYTKAGKEAIINSEKIYVNTILDGSDTSLEVGDQILEVNNNKIFSKEDIDNIVSTYNIGDTIDIKIMKNNQEEIRKAKLIEYENRPILGIVVSKIKEMDTKPKININYASKESGPSGGLMLSLAIYNNLVKEDITKGRIIVGTGTIDEFGNVGSIGGVEYKLKTAVKNKADIFLVPNGENYEEAIKLQNAKKYKIKIKGVSTFDEALNYLLST